MKARFALATVLSLLAGGAFAVGETQETSKGVVFTTPEGMSLYTFDKDVDGKSACAGDCAKKWPPFMAADGAAASGEFGLVARDDGGMQWTYEGHPLYLWMNDKKAGDVTGDGVGGVWHLAKP